MAKQKAASRSEGDKLLRLSLACLLLHSPVTARVCPALCSVGTPGWAREQTTAWEMAPEDGGPELRRRRGQGAGRDWKGPGDRPAGGRSARPSVLGAALLGLLHHQNILPREESLVDQAGEGKGER